MTQKRSERLTYYMYKLNMYDNKWNKLVEAGKNTKNLEGLKILDSMFSNRENLIKTKDKMKKEFLFDD